MVKTKFGWLDVLLIILFLLSVYLILTKLFGHSATPIEITFSVFVVLGGLMYKINREIGEIRIKMINGFIKIREDINKLRKR